MARILIVDDQKIPRLSVRAMLESAGHQVTTAASGPEGLERARSWSPDVIVLDVYMPDMDGFEVVEELKKDPATAPMPVVFLTAEPPTDELIVRGLDLGAYDFLSKGCSRAELLARVGVMARIKRGNDELSAIARISDTLIQSLDPEKLSARFVEQVSEVFRADAVLLAYAPDSDARPLYSTVGVEADDPLTDALAQTLLDALGATDKGLTEIDAAKLRGGAGVLARRHQLRSGIAVQVDRDELPPTLLAVFARREDGFVRGSDAPLLHLLARQANIALDNAVLHAHTRAQAVTMEQQAEQLERAMTERSRFFASMSHELRTPINAVIGYNQLLEYGTYGELSDEQADAVDKVNRSAQHLLELINDILDISKIEAGKLEVNLVPTDLARLVHDTATSVQLQAEEKGLELRLDTPERLSVRTDPARVRQILLNLLSNAVKFTKHGTVEVELRRTDAESARRGDGEQAGAPASGAPWVEMRVCDTGPGIAPEDQERIFEEFEQTQQSVARGGTGLGLAISRRLAHLLGGTLQLRSELGEGATFTLRLPASNAGPATADAMRADGPEGAEPTPP